jgi:ATP-dependent protease ClpP protease subunit
MTDGLVSAPLPTKEVYALFAGDIDQLAVQRLANGIASASSNSVTHLHLAFQTRGGTPHDGVALYNLFRAAPIDFTLYNIGSVSSAGVIAYLGATRRAASTHATFMIHRTMSPAIGATSERLHAMAQSVILDDARTAAIYAAAKLILTPEQEATHKVADLWLSAEEAKTANLATEIKEFATPKGTQLWFIGNA